MASNVVNEPKTGTFQIRVNPEYKDELERLYADCGMTLTQAINIFFQMSLKTGGLPFVVNRDSSIVFNDGTVDYLMEQHRIGMESSKDGPWTSLDEARRKYGGRR